MSTYLALRDRRLIGGVPARPRLRIINTDGSMPLTRAFHGISSTARARQIHTMFVLCHGYAGANEQTGMCMDAGGQGLELGREGMLHANVSLWSAIRGRVQNIVVYACAAGNTEPGNEGSAADGRYLMGALAIHTGAFVYAADRIQWYSTYNDSTKGRYEFGEWEGRLYRFPPNGGFPTVVQRAPVEFGDVMSGSA